MKEFWKDFMFVVRVGGLVYLIGLTIGFLGYLSATSGGDVWSFLTHSVTLFLSVVAWLIILGLAYGYAEEQRALWPKPKPYEAPRPTVITTLSSLATAKIVIIETPLTPDEILAKLNPPRDNQDESGDRDENECRKN